MSAHSLFGGREKLRKADISFDCCIMNLIPKDLQPLRYFTTYRATATCDGVAECRCCANIFVIFEMSMRVPHESQLREPTTYCSCSCADCNLEGGRWSADGILSNGHPDLLGVWTLFTSYRTISSTSVLIVAYFDR